MSEADRRFVLPFKAVKIECLDAEKKPIRTATGFLIREPNDEVFLYTCWHFVTGLDPHELVLGLDPPNRLFLRVGMMNAEISEIVHRIGGIQTFELRLYEGLPGCSRPLWWQDERDEPHEFLNKAQLKLPFWHDVVKIPLPSDVRYSDMQVIKATERHHSLPEVGDPLLIVGFPHGFSTAGDGSPRSVVLTRHIAASSIAQRRTAILLDGPGVEGMSGSPVFSADGERGARFVGVYTGIIHPGYRADKKVPHQALGVVDDLRLIWSGSDTVALRPYST